MLQNWYIHVSNTCRHATDFDAQSIFHCCFAYRVEPPRCPIDQIQINKEAVSEIELYIYPGSEKIHTTIKVLNDGFP